MSFFKKFEDGLLYFNSKDERIRSGADKAGHVAFYIFILEWFFAAILLSLYGPLPSHLQYWALLGLGLPPGIVYIALWILKGLTFADSPKQRKLLKMVAVGLLPLYGAAAWLGSMKVAPEHRVTYILFSSIGATLVVLFVIWIMLKATKARAEKLASTAKMD